MISCRIPNEIYQKFIFEQLKIPKIPDSTSYLADLGFFLVPEWLHCILEYAAQDGTLGKHIEPILPLYQSSYIEIEEKLWCFIIRWILQENPEIESQLNSAVILGGEVGLVSFVDTYLQNRCELCNN